MRSRPLCDDYRRKSIKVFAAIQERRLAASSAEAGTRQAFAFVGMT
jgi:hypothetical protein